MTTTTPPKAGISVVINTYNASQHLRRVLEAVKEFDEIVVCDMESTDDTLDIAREYGAKTVTFPKGNHRHAEPARTFAIQSASCEWVLVVDADEIIPAGLREYLYEFIKNPGDVKGFYINRKNFLFDKFKRSTYPDPQLRFFVREGTVWPPYVHTFPKVQGRVEKLPPSRMELAMIHIPADIYGILDRMNRYTTAEVEKRKKKKITLPKLIFEPWFSFFKSFILQGGIRYGMAGYIAARCDANYRFYRLAKLYEYHKWENNGSRERGEGR